MLLRTLIGFCLSRLLFYGGYPGPDNLFGYTGLGFDFNSGYTYARARYLDSSIGRFVSQDTYEGELNDPQTLNLYTYVLNNPLIYTDPTGNVAASANCGLLCFSAGTKIQTDEGFKAIEDIQVGDRVLAMDEETGETAYKVVQETFQRIADEVYIIEVNGEEITTTEEHPFWIVGKGWVEAKDLVVGELLVDNEGNEYPIEAIEIEKKKTKVYNFSVEGYHNYFVTDLRIWTHNCAGGGNGARFTSNQFKSTTTTSKLSNTSKPSNTGKQSNTSSATKNGNSSVKSSTKNTNITISPGNYSYLKVKPEFKSQLQQIKEAGKLKPISTKGQGGSLKRTFDVQGKKVEINSGHGYRESGHRTGRSQDVGTMDEIESAILKDVASASKTGVNFPSNGTTLERIVIVNGKIVGYSVAEAGGIIRVSTYYPK